MPKKKLHLLIVEDDPVDLDLLRRYFTQEAVDCKIQACRSLQALLGIALRTEGIDLVISDFQLRDGNAFDVIRLFNEAGPEVPVLVVSGAVGERVAVDLMRAGARDFICKEELSRLIPAMEREQGEAAIRREKAEKEGELETLRAAVPCLLCKMNSQGLLLLWNEQWARFSGSDSSATRAADFIWHYIHPGDRASVQARFLHCSENAHPLIAECRILRKDGLFSWHLLHASPSKSAGGTPDSWYVTLMNIDIQKEIALQKEEFLSVTSHELKTPLTSMRLMLQMAKKQVAADSLSASERARIVRYIEHSLQQVDRLNAVSDRMIYSAWIEKDVEEATLEEMNLSSLARECVSELEGEFQKARCRPKLSIAPNVSGRWNRARMRQVILDLLSNVVKHAPSCHFNVTVKAGEREDAILCVDDDGPGIPADIQQGLFRRFTRGDNAARVGGFGLGLYLAGQIVRSHHGFISIDSTPGTGTRVLVRVPLSAGPLACCWGDGEEGDPGRAVQLLVQKSVMVDGVEE